MNELQRVSPPSELERQGPHRPKLAPHHHARTILVIEDDTERSAAAGRRWTGSGSPSTMGASRTFPR
jgi:hypothetical protein